MFAVVGVLLLLLAESQASTPLREYISLGCWKDTHNRAIPTLEGKDPQLGGSYIQRTDAINKCYRAALKKGNTVFAVQNGGWCASSAIAETTYMKYGKASNCRSDGEGGPWANQVYRINVTATTLLRRYTTLGCWKDNPVRAIPTLEGKATQLDGSYIARTDAINKCYQAAHSKGHTVFAVQNGGWCASSANAESTYRKYGQASNCGIDGEGGPWANQVYRINVPVDGGWGDWTDDGACSTTCGLGVKIHSRECNNPIPQSGGKDCVGNSKESVPCEVKQCPAVPVDGGWGNWTDYGACSTTCGQGVQLRSRECNNPMPKSGGKDCVGISKESVHCEVKQCPAVVVNGSWSAWSEWTNCSLNRKGKCRKYHYRKCNSPKPQNGGKKCKGKSRKGKRCPKRACSKS